MSCLHCAQRVKEILLNIDGIKEVSVNLEDKKAIIFCQENTDISKIKKKLDEDGYQLIDVE